MFYLFHNSSYGSFLLIFPLLCFFIPNKHFVLPGTCIAGRMLLPQELMTPALRYMTRRLVNVRRDEKNGKLGYPLMTFL